MKIICCVLVLCMIQIGCSSEYVVSVSPNADPSFNTFNVYAQDRSGTILFQDGTELNARNIEASADSTCFLNEAADSTIVVPTHTINKVVFTSYGAGLVDGLVWGAGIGAVAGAGTIAGLGVAIGSYWGTKETVLALEAAAVVGAMGGVIGGIWGVIAGHSYEYQFPANADSTTR